MLFPTLNKTAYQVSSLNSCRCWDVHELFLGCSWRSCQNSDIHFLVWLLLYRKSVKTFQLSLSHNESKGLTMTRYVLCRAVPSCAHCNLTTPWWSSVALQRRHTEETHDTALQPPLAAHIQTWQGMVVQRWCNTYMLKCRATCFHQKPGLREKWSICFAQDVKGLFDLS